MGDYQREIKRLEEVVHPLDDMRRQACELLEMAPLGEGDDEFQGLLAAEAAALAAEVDEASRRARRGPKDHMPCCLSIKAGGGGDEACLWAQMLLRMYTQYAKRKDLGVDLVDVQPNDPSGIKSALLRFDGPAAYGTLRPEEGLHRLSRISPLGHSERHTSFCSVSVFPELEPSDAPRVDAKDVEETFCCGGGPGGQNKNRRATAVRLKHLPTGVTVRCEGGRHQGQNRKMAMAILASKMAQMEADRAEEEAKEARKGRPGIGFGNRDRTYVLVPQPLVHDHRTGRKVKDAQRVLDGDLDYLRGPENLV